MIDSATFLVSAGLVLRVKYDPSSIQEGAQTSGFRDMIDGFKYVLKEKGIGFLVMIKSIGQIGSADILIAVYAERYFPYGQEGATALGIMFAASGLGAIIGPLIARAFGGTSSQELKSIIQKSYLLIPVGWLLFAVSPTLWGACIGVAVRMMGISINWTYSNVLIQYRVPDRILGRVFAIDLGLFTLANSTAVLLTGVFLDAFQLMPRYLVGGFSTATLLVTIIWAASRVSVFRKEKAREV